MISYYIIEKPSRNKLLFGKRQLVITLSLFTVLLIGLNAAVIHFKGAPSRLPPIIGNIEMQPRNIKVCNGELSCSFNPQYSKNIFLIGDSHMMSLEKPLLSYATNNNYRFTTLNANGCQYIPNLNSVNKLTKKKNKCDSELQETRREILLSNNNSLVIIGGRLPFILSESSFGKKEGISSVATDKQLQPSDKLLNSKADRNKIIFKEYKEAILELANHGHKVVVIYPIPETGWDIPSKLSQMVFRKNKDEIIQILTNNPVTTSFEAFKSRALDSFKLLDSIQHKNIVRVYPHKLLCNTFMKDRCVTHDLNNAFYRDNHHLSNTGTEMLMHDVIKAIELSNN